MGKNPSTSVLRNVLQRTMAWYLFWRAIILGGYNSDVVSLVMINSFETKANLIGNSSSLTASSKSCAGDSFGDNFHDTRVGVKRPTMLPTKKVPVVKLKHLPSRASRAWSMSKYLALNNRCHYASKSILFLTCQVISKDCQRNIIWWQLMSGWFFHMTPAPSIFAPHSLDNVYQYKYVDMTSTPLHHEQQG